MAIDFIRDGVHIDERDWDSADPREDRIAVRFGSGARVVVTVKFMRDALALIEHVRASEKRRREERKEKG